MLETAYYLYRGCSQPVWRPDYRLLRWVYDEKQMPKCSSEIHTRNYAQKTRSKKFRRGCRSSGHDENCFFVQRRITYLLIRWKCSDSRSEAAWPLAHKNVRIANNPWNSFHPGLHCFQIPSLSDFSASFTLVTADYSSTELAIQLIPERDTLITVMSQDGLENLIKSKSAFDPHKHARNSFGSNWIVSGLVSSRCDCERKRTITMTRSHCRQAACTSGDQRVVFVLKQNFGRSRLLGRWRCKVCVQCAVTSFPKS